MIVQSPNQPGRIFDALRAAASPDVTDVRLAVAYVTLSGVRQLVEAMEQEIGPAWSQVDKQLVTCVDFGFTDPDALREWLKLSKSRVFLHNTKVKNPLLRPPQAFHAKYYEFRRAGAATIALGSANLSKAAFTTSHEVMALLALAGDLGTADAAWRQLKRGAATATPAIIDAYENRRKAISVPVSNAVFVGASPVRRLWGAIEAGETQPRKHRFFWVEAGSMSSGGSSNQLELPRGGHRFFGGSVTYTDKSKKIIDLKIRVKGTPHDRPLSWHGSNKMERLNLPTGEDYSYRTVLFERWPAGYSLSFARTGSPITQSWADRSAAIDELYKVGERSPRRCGFF